MASFQHRCSALCAGWIPTCCSEMIHPSSGYRAPLPLPSSSLAELEFVGPFLRRREYNTATDGFRVRPAELASWSSWSGVLWRGWELAKGRDHARAERFQRTSMTGANEEDSDEVFASRSLASGSRFPPAQQTQHRITRSTSGIHSPLRGTQTMDLSAIRRVSLINRV